MLLSPRSNPNSMWAHNARMVAQARSREFSIPARVCTNETAAALDIKATVLAISYRGLGLYTVTLDTRDHGILSAYLYEEDRASVEAIKAAHVDGSTHEIILEDRGADAHVRGRILVVCA